MRFHHFGEEAYAESERAIQQLLEADGELVDIRAPPAGGVARFTVLLDGEPAGVDAGVDVDETGVGAVTEPRMYQLVRQRGPVRARTFEMRFEGPGASAYVFTFG